MLISIKVTESSSSEMGEPHESYFFPDKLQVPHYVSEQEKEKRKPFITDAVFLPYFLLLPAPSEPASISYN